MPCKKKDLPKEEVLVSSDARMNKELLSIRDIQNILIGHDYESVKRIVRYLHGYWTEDDKEIVLGQEPKEIIVTGVRQ